MATHRHLEFMPAILLGLAPLANAQEFLPPEHVRVRPVFLVPIGQQPPTDQQQADFMAHLQWSQERFHEMLDCRGTFTISPEGLLVYPALHTLAYYQQQPESGAPQWMAELLAYEGHDRFSTPHIYAIVVMSPAQNFPPGGGRPCNGGFDTGGGIIILSSFSLDNHPNFQSTLQHELGHAFGLPHVDVYGYSMATNDSIMSYNPAHHTDGFEPSATPGQLIPEDVRGLAWNDRVFPRLAFDDAIDLPPGYTLATAVWLGPMTIPGQLDNHVAMATASGEAFGSSVQNAVQGRIKPSIGPGITYDAGSMWHSDVSGTGWVSVEASFPGPVLLDRLDVHSQHSGAYHRAEHVTVAASVEDGQMVVADSPLDDVDDSVAFPATQAQHWTFSFQAGPSGMVVIRGLQFYREGVELFPPFIPEPVGPACLWDLDGDGAVGVGDLVITITNWGVAPAGPADFDCDGLTGVSDLVALITNWGQCPGAG